MPPSPFPFAHLKATRPGHDYIRISSPGFSQQILASMSIEYIITVQEHDVATSGKLESPSSGTPDSTGILLELNESTSRILTDRLSRYDVTGVIRAIVNKNQLDILMSL